MTYPKCFFSQRQHDHWVRLAKASKADPDWPCIDCTDTFQRRMYREGRCEHPEAIPGEGRPCPAPSVDDKPEASSGKPRKRGRKPGAKPKPMPSAPSAANPCSENSKASGSEAVPGRKRGKRRSP